MKHVSLQGALYVHTFPTIYIYSYFLCIESVWSLIADPGVVSLILARPDTFVEIDHEIFSMVILLLLLIQEGLLSVTSECMCREYWLTT